MLRQDAIAKLKEELEEVDATFEAHKAEASEAIAFHKALIAPAADIYKEISSSWNDLHKQSDPSDETIDAFIDLACKFVFQMSSDYQQDKSIPSWNMSPQPGATYYLSALTQYVHIICLESCGKRNDSSKKSRNLVFVRDERVAGAKTCDDTLSTMAEALYGRKRPASSQPPRYRTGYGPNGKLAL